MTGGDALTKTLLSEGTDTVFGIPGVQLDGLTDGMYRHREELGLVVPRHEQATTYMADGFARVSARPGVAMVVPGPGVLNAGAGLATAYACSTPVLLVAGTIPSPLVGAGLGALHEIPAQTETLAGLTKWAARPTRAEEIPELVHEAYRQMRSGRPRPTAIEVAPDLLHQEIDVTIGEPFAVARPPLPATNVHRLADLMRRSRRIVLYVGGGVKGQRAFDLLPRLAAALDAAVVMTDNGRGAIDARDPHALPAFAMRTLRERADLVIGLGTRFVTPFGAPVATGSAQVALVNADPADLAAPRDAALTICADATDVLAALVPQIEPQAGWGEELVRERTDSDRLVRGTVAPQMAFVDAIRAALPDDGILVNELTQVGYVSTYGFPVHAPRSYVWPGYQGTLGYAVPTALGATVGAGGRAVVVLTGDGGFGWSLQELATARKYGIPTVIVLFEDGRFGNVWRIQRDSYGGRFIGSDLTNPDFSVLAQAFGVAFTTAADPAQVQRAIGDALTAGVPTVVRVPVGDFPSPWSLIHERH
ncbi:thiamine pyrophosphate-binding protein [Microbacterium sp.]|uniref:thiamine pyrophosphate-binding protein n=1 Tax=Microbacterium sp. TaxID=51671 RepID=UPI003A899FAB